MSLRILGRLVAVISASLTLVLCCAMVWFCRYGFSFDDEGFAMVWISTPGLFPASVSEFGFIYRPLFLLVGSDIALFRQVVLLTLFLSGWLLFDLRKVLLFGPGTRFLRLAASSGLAASALSWYSLWLLAPSYNTLTLQALVIVAIGMILVADDSRAQAATGSGLLGVGGWLAFMAKPTTAAVLAVIVVVWVLVARRFRLTSVAITGAVVGGLLLASALLIDGSIGDFIERLRIGSELVRILDAGHTLGESFRLESYRPGLRLFLVTILVGATLAAVAFALRTASTFRRVVWWGAAVVAFASGALLSRGHIHELAASNIFHASTLLALPLAALVVGVRHRGMAGIRKMSLAQIALGLGFLSFPYAYAFGTNTSYWQAAGAAAMFWILGGLVLLVPLRGHPRLPVIVLSFGITAQLLVGVMVQAGSLTPYRQPRVVGEDTISTTMGANGSKLRLPPDVSRYVTESTQKAEQAGFRPGDRIIDLTGKSPGTLFVLGAETVGDPWNLGAYPGSARTAVRAIDLMSCQRVGSAWLLIEPDGPRRLPLTILPSFGIDFAADYDLAATWKTANGMGGYPTSQVQQLWKPNRPIAEASKGCSTAKGLR